MNAYLAYPSKTVHSRRLAVYSVLSGGLAYLLAKAPLSWIVIVVTATAAGSVILLSPAVGITLIAAAIPFGQLVTIPLPGMNLVDLLVGGTLFIWLLQGMAKRRVVFRPPPLMWPLLIFLWVSGLSLIQASSWREGIAEWLKWIEFAALYLVGTQILKRGNSQIVIASLFLAGVAQVGIGAYQFFGQVGPEAFGLSNRFMRAYGTFQQPNPYAGYLGCLAPLAVSLAVAAGERWWANRRPTNLLATSVYTATALTLAAGILMSWSRGAWIGLAISVILVVCLRNRRMAAVALSGSLLVVLLCLVLGTNWLPGGITARISTLGDVAVNTDLVRTEITDANFAVLERLAHWQAGLGMFQEHPWLGVGIGNYAVAYPAYAPPHWYEPLGHAHNVFINFLAETGVLGLASFGAFWLGAGWLAWRRAVRGDSFQRALALGVLGTWVYLSIHSIFDNLFVQHIQLQLTLLLIALTPQAPELS